MHYTSGTTGRPKGVWSGVLSDSDATRLWGEEQEQWQFAADDVHLVCSPLQHSAPIRFALGTLLAGGTVVLPGPFSVEVSRRRGAHAPTTTFCTPAHLQRLDEQGSLAVLSSSAPSVRTAGAPCPDGPAAARDRGARFDAVGVLRLDRRPVHRVLCRRVVERPGTVGRARTGRLSRSTRRGRRGVTRRPGPDGRTGGPPRRTAEAWRDDASRSATSAARREGYLSLVGRRRRLIITGGVNVYPAEVERVLARVPGVLDLVVFPRPDERWGQRVCVAVVGEVDAGDGAAVRATHLAAFKRPEGGARRGDDSALRPLQGPPRGRWRKSSA
jgi:long-chain acyl-CoA synthetase